MPKPQPAKPHAIANQPAQMHPHFTTTVRSKALLKSAEMTGNERVLPKIL